MLKREQEGEWFTCEVRKRKNVYNLSPGTFNWRKVEDDVENAENKVNFAGSDDKSIINECYLQDEEVHKVYAVKVPHN